ncbi:MAG: SusD/RagB family nutrient-binding outer membrane lipoprotein [Bacteroidetes bacterium]|nr:SusD/RagB family nutrient-binding outer membrane lipoprotein [Bacteroidota bacterium]
MKKINIKVIGVLFLIALTLGSCKKWIDTDLNINPDAPTDAPMGSILTTAEVNMGFVTVGGNDYVRITSIWLQYVHGIARQSESQTQYILSDGDMSGQWNDNYGVSMEDIHTLLQKATAANHYYYKGIAEVLLANALGVTTDVWNQIPYSEAFQGAANLQPKFDSQEAVYTAIFKLLNQAIQDFSVEGFSGEVTGDIIYGGDVTLWMKAAYAFKARYALHTMKLNASIMPSPFDTALAALPHAFSDNAEDLQINFQEQYDKSNPLYLFMDNRGDIVMDSVFIAILTGHQDPRIAVFATSLGENLYVGAGWNYAGEDCSLPGTAVANPDSPVPLITNVECHFIKAECSFKKGDEAAAKVSLFEGLKASLDKFGVYSDLYFQAYQANLAAVSGAPLYKEIMMQKYIALFYQAESYNDWRRTDNAIGLVANPNAGRSEIPRRFPYANTEKTANANTPVVSDNWQRVWWDAGTPSK